MPDREEIARTPIPHSEVVEAVSKSLGDDYPDHIVRVIVDEYIRVLMQAVGTGRPVTLKQLGQVQVEVRKPRRRVNERYQLKEPFRLIPRLRLSLNGRMKIRRVLSMVNHVIHTDPNDPAIRVVSKRWKL